MTEPGSRGIQALREYQGLSLGQAVGLLPSSWHEERLLALLIPTT